MVIIKAAHERSNRDGKIFVSLELTGDLELVQSQNNGKFYATVRRCFVSSTLDLESAKHFIGKQMPGKIVRQYCEPYDYEIKETREVVSLAHTYSYVPDEAPVNASEDLVETW